MLELVTCFTGTGENFAATGDDDHCFCWNCVFVLLGPAKKFAAIRLRQAIVFAGTGRFFCWNHTFILLEPCFICVFFTQCHLFYAEPCPLFLLETCHFLLEPRMIFAATGDHGDRWAAAGGSTSAAGEARGGDRDRRGRRRGRERGGWLSGAIIFAPSHMR